MYNARYESSNGHSVDLGFNANCVFDIRGIGGVGVTFGRAQNYADVGESVTSQSVAGSTLTINGVIFGDNISGKKKEIRQAFAPLTRGTLKVDNKYFIDVFVKQTPTLSPVKDDGRFSVQLFAPFPFFRKISTSAYRSYSLDDISAIIDNYQNAGDIPVPMKITITVSNNGEYLGFVHDIIISLIGTNKALKFSSEGVLSADHQLEIYRDTDGTLKAIQTLEDGTQIDFLKYIDSNSDLLDAPLGSNGFALNYKYNPNGDSDNADPLTCSFLIEFNEAYGGIYEI